MNGWVGGQMDGQTDVLTALSHPGDGRRPDDGPPLLLWLPHVVLVILQILRRQQT